MSTAELQNSIIQKVLKISDSQLLDYLNSLLLEDESSSYYSMNEWEMKVIQESGLSSADWLVQVSGTANTACS